MEFNVFGWTITNKEKEEQKLTSFAPPSYDDGAVVVAAGGTFGTYIDLDGTIRTEAELVTRYREMSLQPEIDKAINEVVNEAIVIEDDKEIVALSFEGDEFPYSEEVKTRIIEEFKELLNIIDFKKNAFYLFRRWYIDGRLYHHVVIDENAASEGIKELRYIDPRKIRKIREIEKKKDVKTQTVLQRTKAEYYLYSDMGLQYSSKSALPSMGSQGIKIKKDSIIHTVSGLMDSNNKMVLSYLHPAIKQMNILRALEDATIIYHLSRAPERRVFNVDIGNLPKAKAEQYMKELMTLHKNKISYNATTGQITDDRKFMTMLEDFWFPKREGRGTEVDVLSGGTALPQLLQTVEYFQDLLYRALQVPLTRMKPEAIYNLGRATEITRDEVNFSKFIDRLRQNFTEFLIDALEKQLILKEIIAPEDWDEIKKYMDFEYARDNYFTELKESEMMTERLNTLDRMEPYVGKYISHKSVRSHILKQTDEEIKEEDSLILDELKDPRFNPPPEETVLNNNVKPK